MILQHRPRLHIFIGVVVGFAMTLFVFLVGKRVAADPPQPLPTSSLRAYALRLKPGQDVKKELLAYAQREGLKAAAIVTCVGSLTDVNVRLANQKGGTVRQGHFEITSLVGILDPAGGHLHLGVTDKDGVAFGGHLLDGNLVYTTAEIVLVELTDLEFRREVDPTFGYKELTIVPRGKSK